eukprot:scaffold1467_cov30-Tisochrysis_lutea.AAC.4
MCGLVEFATACRSSGRRRLSCSTDPVSVCERTSSRNKGEAPLALARLITDARTATRSNEASVATQSISPYDATRSEPASSRPLEGWTSLSPVANCTDGAVRLSWEGSVKGRETPRRRNGGAASKAYQKARALLAMKLHVGKPNEKALTRQMNRRCTSGDGAELAYPRRRGFRGG